MTPLKPFIVGIDPGVSTGVAVWSRTKNAVTDLYTKDFFSVQLYLQRVFPDKTQVKVFVEHPPKFVYGRNRKLEGGERDNYTVDVGGNRREAQLLAETLRRLGFTDLELVAPVCEKKWDSQRFRLMTGMKRATSQHERDAARLAIYYANRRQEHAK